MRRHSIYSKAIDGLRWRLTVVDGQHPLLAFGTSAQGVWHVSHPSAAPRPNPVAARAVRAYATAARIGLMLWRIAVALLRSPITLLSALLCLGLGAIGFGGAYLLLTLGLQTFSDASVAWLLAAFGLLWGAFWLYMLGVVVRASMDDD